MFPLIYFFSFLFIILSYTVYHIISYIIFIYSNIFLHVSDLWALSFVTISPKTRVYLLRMRGFQIACQLSQMR